VGISFPRERQRISCCSRKKSDWSQSACWKVYAFSENEKIEKIGQNLKFWFKKYFPTKDITVEGKLFDNFMIAHYLTNPDMRHNMDILAETYLKYSPKPIEDLIGKRQEPKIDARCRIRGKSKNTLPKMLISPSVKANCFCRIGKLRQRNFWRDRNPFGKYHWYGK
jgi:DNA polymerase I-like protein with 3'-5' exonuclease and polymerase domains